MITIVIALIVIIVIVVIIIFILGCIASQYSVNRYQFNINVGYQRCRPAKAILHCRQLSVPWASYQIRKIVGCACAGNAKNVFPANDFK